MRDRGKFELHPSKYTIWLAEFLLESLNLKLKRWTSYGRMI